MSAPLWAARFLATTAGVAYAAYALLEKILT